jgi:hypothetical protein
MKQYLSLLPAAILSFTLMSASAQPGPRGGMGPPPGPQWGGEMKKLFGDNSAFSATMEMHVAGSADDATLDGKMAYADGKSHFEMDISQIKNSKMNPKSIAQMKQMGMDKIVAISRPDKGVSYQVYPGLQAYVENPVAGTAGAAAASDYKMEITELGKETVDGHDCVKNKAVVTSSTGKTWESTVWNATDLKKFPVKIVTGENGKTVTLLFKDILFATPDASQFDPPADFKKYDNMMTLMQTEIMKRMGRGGPPGQ